MRFVTIAGGVAAGGVALMLCWLLHRLIGAPVKAMTTAMGKIAAGDTTVSVPASGRGDEIGAMAAAVQVFKDNVDRARALEREKVADHQRQAGEEARMRREAEEQAAAAAASLVVGSIGAGLERLAGGDLTYRLDQALPPAYEKLRADLNSALSEMDGVVGSIIGSTAGIRSGTGEIAQAADDLSRRTEQQAASLEQTAAALGEITATVKRTAGG